MNLPSSRPRRAAILALAAAAILLPSCGDDEGRPRRYPAAGKVLVDGKGEKGIQVRLVPVDALRDVDALRPSGLTDDQGSYRLGTYEDDDGAPAGTYKAILFWPDAPPGPGRPGDLFAGKYSRPESSTIEFTIAEGENQLADIEATRSGAPAKPRPTARRKNAPGAGTDPDAPSTK